MRLELIPVLLGICFGVAGLALIADALVPDGTFVPAERRRHARAPRHALGELALGLGTVGVAVTLIGGDWPYALLVVVGSAILLIIGIAFNWSYVRGLVVGRADATRFDPDAASSPRTDRERSGRLRIR